MEILPNILQIFTPLKELALLVFAGVGTYVAWQGLKIWKKQHAWLEDNKLAKEFYTNLYKLKDAITWARNPLITSAEFEKAMPPNEDTKKRNERYDEIYAVYSKRWNVVVDAQQAIYPQIIESEVLWGGELKEYYHAVKSHICLLYTSPSPRDRG